MLYDLAAAPPEPGSLLESVFLLVSLRRREAELYQTEVLMNAIMLAGSENPSYELLDKAFQEYKNTLFPFIEAEKIKTDADTRKALEYWSKQVFHVKPLWQATKNRRRSAQLRTGEKASARAEHLREVKTHRRIK